MAGHYADALGYAQDLSIPKVRGVKEAGLMLRRTWTTKPDESFIYQDVRVPASGPLPTPLDAIPVCHQAIRGPPPCGMLPHHAEHDCQLLISR